MKTITLTTRRFFSFLPLVVMSLCGMLQMQISHAQCSAAATCSFTFPAIADAMIANCSCTRYRCAFPAECVAQCCSSPMDNENTNFGSVASLYLKPQGSFDGFTYTRRRSMVKMDISTIPAGATIVAAYLYFYVSSTSGDNASNSIDISKLNRNWTEAGVTYIKYDGVTNWATAGGTGALDIDPSTSVSIVCPFTGWVCANVTTDVANFYSGADPNYGWLLRNMNGIVGSDNIYVDAREGANDPYLSVYWNVAGCIPLPVTLLSFKADCYDKSVQINWATASESNNDYFTIERSLSPSGGVAGGGFEWAPVGTVKGAGNSSTMRNYEFTDIEVLSKYSILNTQYYYRLKQTDYDGKYEYFGPISVNCNLENTSEPIVTPTINTGEFTVYSLRSPVQIQVYNLLGEIVFEKSYSTNMANIHLYNRANGVYIIAIRNAEKQDVNKIVISR